MQPQKSGSIPALPFVTPFALPPFRHKRLPVFCITLSFIPLRCATLHSRQSHAKSLTFSLFAPLRCATAARPPADFYCACGSKAAGDALVFKRLLNGRRKCRPSSSSPFKHMQSLRCLKRQLPVFHRCADAQGGASLHPFLPPSPLPAHATHSPRLMASPSRPIVFMRLKLSQVRFKIDFLAV